MATVPGTSHRDSSSLRGPATPETFACSRFRLLPFRSPLLWESRLIYIPVGTEMCHFPTFAVMSLWIQDMLIQIALDWVVPFRRSRDPLVCSSPGLIAAYHVLHRLLAPRHPPYTLSNLTALIPLPESTPVSQEPTRLTASSRAVLRTTSTSMARKLYNNSSRHTFPHY